MATTVTDTARGIVRATVIADRPIAAYTLITAGDARRCDGHRTDNTAGYVVRHTIDNGSTIINPDDSARVGVDVWAVACAPHWGNYDQALTAARRYRQGRSYAVIDTLYLCGHRGGA